MPGQLSFKQVLLLFLYETVCLFLFNQVIYISCLYATVYLIYMKFRATYDGNHDSFRVEFLIVPVGGLAVLINHDFSPLEVNSAALCSNGLILLKTHCNGLLNQINLSVFRSFGRSPSTWSLWPSFLSSSWSARPGRLRPSPPTTCSAWACIGPSIFSTGSGVTTSRASLTWLLSWRVWSRLSSIVTSSTFMLPKVGFLHVHCRKHELNWHWYT